MRKTIQTENQVRSRSWIFDALQEKIEKETGKLMYSLECKNFAVLLESYVSFELVKEESND